MMLYSSLYPSLHLASIPVSSKYSIAGIFIAVEVYTNSIFIPIFIFIPIAVEVYGICQ